MNKIRGWQGSIAILIICLVITMPLASAQFDTNAQPEFDEQETGTSIQVQVNSYEPQIIPSNVLEEDDAPVYAFLSGTTAGSILSEASSATSGRSIAPTSEPFYSTPDITSVVIRPIDETTAALIRGNPQYIRPREYDMDNLGYLRIFLRQVGTEAELPDEITLNMEAEITFENAERLFSLIQQDVVLPLDSDEQIWRSKPKSQYSFFAGKGAIRATGISSSDASLIVYSNNDFAWPYGGTPSPIRSLSLDVGETSDYIRLQESGDLIQNAFRIKLIDVIDQTEKRVKFTIESDGRLQEVVAAEGSRLFPGSEWTVSRIDVSETDEGTKYEVTITAANDRKTITAVYPKGTIENTGRDPCESSPVLLGNLASLQEQNSNSALNSSSLLKISELKSITAKSLEGEDTLSSGVYLITTNIGTGTATMRVDNIQENIQRQAGWMESGKELTQIYVTEVNRLTNTNKQEFTLRQGNSRRVSLGDYTYVITLDSIDNNNAIVKVVKTRNVTPGSAPIRPTVSISTTQPSEEIATAIEKTSKDFVYCTAIQEYKKVTTDYQGIKDNRGVLLADRASYNIGKIYDELGYPRLAIQYYQKSLENGIGEFIIEAQSKITSLENEAESGARVRRAVIQDNGREVHVRVGSIFGEDSKPKAALEVDSKIKRLALGEKVFDNDVRVSETRGTPSYSYNWRVKELSEDLIVIEKFARSGTLPSGESWSEIIDLRETKLIDGNSVRLNNIDTQKFALVRVIPGTGRPLISRSNFTLRIPIEKRAIQQTPNEIAGKINSTEDVIKTLDKIINRLDKVVRVWKQVCLVTFAYLTLKNSFLTGLSRTQARRFAMRGQDGRSGWNVYCQQNSGPNKAYSNYNSCLNSNMDRISRMIDESQGAIGQVNDEISNYKEQKWFKDLTRDYQQLNNYGQYNENLFNKDNLRDYRYWQLMKESSSYSELNGQQDNNIASYNFRQEVDRQVSSFNFDQNSQEYNNAVSIINERYPNFDSLPEEERKQVFNDVLGSSDADVSSEEFIFLGDLGIKQLPSLRRDETGIFANTPNGRITLSEATVQDYIQKLSSQSSAGSANEILEEVNRVNRNYERNPRAPLISSQGQVYVDSSKNFYVADTLAFSTGQTREDYDSHAIWGIYPGGRPYCVPTSDGNYAKILDFYQDDSPKTIQEWNVGTDGLLCTQDDVLVRHQSVLARPENEEEQNRLIELASRAGRKQKGEVVSADGQNFIVDDSLSRNEQNIAAPQCFDVMDPSDCQTLFGVCDPVMCPASRFNLGGAWQVDDVVQSGLIGSLVLGLHNFNAKEPVPICLTGVLAGLRNIKSILDGYVQCLKIAQTEGKSVGICDTIRSIFTCELIWKEATSIFKVRGSIFKWIGQRVFGQSEQGGEYLTLQQSFTNVEDSVNFFTKEYAAQSFAAYNSRSSDEIGSSLCKAAIYGKSPELGNMIEQLSVPESPAQYIATLSVSPYSETLQQSRYSVYYHIYAGENNPADYSVFMKSETGDVYYMTEECRGRSGHIDKGSMADHTIDCVAPINFKEVCIMVNGNAKCGFGKVSTDFSLNYLNDMIVADDVQRQISSEEDCFSSEPQGSPALLGLGVASAFGLPYATEAARAGTAAGDLATTGIARVCSVKNPGSGTNPQDYKVVGTCGKDANDHVLGSCWIDLRTVTIRDAERQAEISGQLEAQTIANERERLGVVNTIDKEHSRTIFNQVESLDKSSCIKRIDALKQYDDLAERSISYDISGTSRMRVAESYGYLAEHCAKLDPLREFNRVIAELEEKLQSIINTFNNNVDAVRQTSTAAQVSSTITSETNSALQQMNQLEQEYKAKVSSLNVQVSEALSVSAVVQSYKSRISSGESIQGAPVTRSQLEINAEELACSRCGDGAFNSCDAEECHGINSNCYLSESANEVFGVDVTDAINNECHSCGKASDCSSFDSDRLQCENNRCVAQSSLRCSWLQTGSAGKCVPSNGVTGQPEERAVARADCSRCGGLISYSPCDASECHSNGPSCYHVPGSVFGGDCSSCDNAQTCSDFDGDKSRCNNYDQCTSNIGKRCSYNDADEACRESLAQEGEQQQSRTNTNVVTTPDYGTITLIPSTQCGSDDNCEFLEDASKDERGRAIDMVLLHTTDGRRAINTHNRFGPNGEASGLSVNYILDRPGNIIQEVEERYAAHHTGITENKRSVGIEIANSGTQCTNICTGSNAPDCSRSDCISVPGEQALFEQFSEAQIKALVKLVSEILLRNNLGVSDIRQHGKKYEGDECAPPGLSNSRTDPGPLFDWCKFNRNVQAAVEQYKASQNSEISTGTNILGWTAINTRIGEDFSAITYDSNMGYKVSQVIGEYLKTKNYITASQRQKFISSIDENARRYNVNPYVIAATIELESGWNENNFITERDTGERSYGPMQCNAAPEVNALPESQRASKLLEIKERTKTIEGGINCGTQKLSQLIQNRNAATFGDLRVGFTPGPAYVRAFQEAGRDPMQAFPPGSPNAAKGPAHERNIPRGNALIKRLIEDNQRLSGSQQQAQTNPTRQPQTTNARKVAVMGDSITAWGGTAPSGTLNCNTVTAGGNNYVNELRSKCSGSTFTNLGIGGQQTTQMVQRFDNQVTNCNYNEVIILGGVNDVTSDRSAAQIKESLSSMYQQAKDDNLKVIAVTITPWKGWTRWTAQRQQVTEEVNGWIMSEANVDVRVNAYSAMVDPNDPGKLKSEYVGPAQPGGYLHPGTEGQKAIARAIIAAAYPNQCR